MTENSNETKASPKDLLKALDALGIVTKSHSHAPLMTVEDSQRLRGDIKGLHSKNLFLKDKKKQLWLIVCEENVVINLKSLKTHLGSAALSFAKRDLLFDVLGVLAGSVTPFSVLNDSHARVRIVLDQTLAQAKLVNFHPLINTQTTTISGADLCKFLDAYGHAPIVMDFTKKMN
ncbi:MAG: prolyl-tRNA synthetase associated domain-containing protein [Magnetovibrio sp.]|nr:prolyl-tRNA synthetase associated domain-containing protein [Magnetovibrio sp.]